MKKLDSPCRTLFYPQGQRLPKYFRALFEIHFVSMHKETLSFNTKAPAWTSHQVPELNWLALFQDGGALLPLQLCFPNFLPGDGSGLHAN